MFLSCGVVLFPWFDGTFKISMLDIAQDKLIITTVKVITNFRIFRLFKNLWEICFKFAGIDLEESAITRINCIVRIKRNSIVLVIVATIYSPLPPWDFPIFWIHIT